MRDKAATSPRSVAVILYDGVSPFEFGVVCDVFGGEYYGPEFGVPWYQLTVCAATPSVRLDAGLRMEVPAGLDAVGTAATVIVVPTEQPGQVPAAVLDALRAARARGQRILSLCTGAFILAAAGILDGHRATTHWSECAALAGRAAMSPRTFARRFLASTGATPYQWIVRERIRLAQRLLETTDLPVDAVAAKTGLRTAGNLRKHFTRTVRTSPHAYRDAFRGR